MMLLTLAAASTRSSLARAMTRLRPAIASTTSTAKTTSTPVTQVEVLTPSLTARHRYDKIHLSYPSLLGPLRGGTCLHGHSYAGLGRRCGRERCGARSRDDRAHYRTRFTSSKSCGVGYTAGLLRRGDYEFNRWLC